MESVGGESMVIKPLVLDDPQRLAAACGSIPDVELDAELQGIVREAGELTGFPIALVSLVLRRIQFFKAHIGLPPELARSCSTDRCASFCQFVVSANQPLHIADTAVAPELPRALINSYNIRAYYGVPLRVEGQPIGSLCVIDQQPRVLSKQQGEGLRALAVRAEARLQTLASASSRIRRQLYHAVTPAFGELRNILQIMSWDLENSRLALLELRGVKALLDAAAAGELSHQELVRGLGMLSESYQALDDLGELVGSLRSAEERARRVFMALEAGLEENLQQHTRLARAVSVASELAEHYTRPKGGVRWGRIPSALEVSARSSELIALLALGLRGMAERGDGGGLFGAVVERGEEVELRIRGALSDADRAALLAELSLVEASGVELVPGERDLCLRVPIHKR